jgi:hypothetical protein
MAMQNETLLRQEDVLYLTLCVIKSEEQVVIFGASVAVLVSLLPRQINATTF